jgi:hypothetical protein
MSKQTALQWFQSRISTLIPEDIGSQLMFKSNLKKALEMERKESEITENTSDGYHTFKELYEFRKVYNAGLFNEWANFDIPQYDVHKSWKHHDGELCFGGGWFIVVANLPNGQISNHYEAKDWELFQIPIAEKAKYEFDGHTGKDVLDRIKALYGGKDEK